MNDQHIDNMKPGEHCWSVEVDIKTGPVVMPKFFHIHAVTLRDALAQVETPAATIGGEVVAINRESD